MIIIYCVLLIITFYLLSFVSDRYFVTALEKISEKLKLSSEVTGATFMAIGSSAPELFTSIFAIFTIFGASSNENIGSGTIVGSAIFNILIIIGLSLIFSKKNQKLQWQPIIRDLVFYSLTIGVLIFSFWDGQVSFLESWIFVVLYGCYIYVVSQRWKWLNYTLDEDKYYEENTEPSTSRERFLDKIFTIYHKIDFARQYRIAFIISIILIGILSHIMVNAAVQIATFFGISETIIGLTILAGGTSVPDAISSILVAKRWKVSMSFTNALGSNIFDILFGLGAVYFVYFLFYGIDTTIAIDNHNLLSSVFLLFATVLLVLIVLFLKKRKTNKTIWFLLVFVYAIYLAYMVYHIL